MSSGGWVAKPLLDKGISRETLTSWMYAGLGSFHWHAVQPLPCGATLFVKGVCGAALYPLEACQTGYDFGIGLFSPSQLQPVARPSLAGKGEGLQNIEI